MRISDWSSDVCSSDLVVLHRLTIEGPEIAEVRRNQVPAPGNADVAGCRASIVQGVDTVVQLLLIAGEGEDLVIETTIAPQIGPPQRRLAWRIIRRKVGTGTLGHAGADLVRPPIPVHVPELEVRSEEHTSELQS